MFDIGWTELLVIGIVALIVVGPKDLPGMFRALGRFTAKMRSLAREFQRAMNQAAEESGVSDVTSDLKALRSAKSLGLDSIQDAADRFKGGWKSGLSQTGAASAEKPVEAKAESSAANDKAAVKDPKETAPNDVSSSGETAPPPAAPKPASVGTAEKMEAEPEDVDSPKPDDAKVETASKAGG